MNMPRVEVDVTEKLDTLRTNIALHEYPIMVAANGGSLDNIRFVRETGEVTQIDDIGKEWERLERCYGDQRSSNKTNVAEAFVDRVHFATTVLSDSYVKNQLNMLREMNPANEDVQPKEGEFGYLSNVELVQMLRKMGDNSNMDGTSRAALRAAVIIQLDEKARDAKIIFGPLETDPQLSKVFNEWVKKQH